MADARPPEDLPPDIRRSASGRVPQWVLDEAAGRPVGPVPFRAASPSTFLDPPPARRRRRWGSTAMAVMVVAAIVAGGMYWSLSRTPTGPAAAPDTGGAGPSATATTIPRIPGFPPQGLEEGARPASAAGAVPRESSTSGFRLIRHQDDGVTAVAWSPCRPIHFVVRRANEPPGGAAILTTAIATVSRATGLTFVDDGATAEPPVEDRRSYQLPRYGDRWAPVLITWATADEIPDMGIDVIGEAGPVGYGTASGDDAYVSGELHLDAVAMAEVLRGTKGRELATAVVLHELGHLVGLAHVNDTRQLMYPRAEAGRTTFGPGDLRGLAALGKGACQPDI